MGYSSEQTGDVVLAARVVIYGSRVDNSPMTLSQKELQLQYNNRRNAPLYRLSHCELTIYHNTPLIMVYAK